MMQLSKDNSIKIVISTKFSLPLLLTCLSFALPHNKSNMRSSICLTCFFYFLLYNQYGNDAFVDPKTQIVIVNYNAFIVTLNRFNVILLWFRSERGSSISGYVTDDTNVLLISNKKDRETELTKENLTLRMQWLMTTLYN